MKRKLNEFDKNIKFGSWCNHCKYCGKATIDNSNICNDRGCLILLEIEIRKRNEG